MKKTILITGASSGFGKETAIELLATQNYIVYAAARRVELMEDLKSLGAHILLMDVTSSSAIESGVNQIIQEQGRLDILFANAGYGSFGMIESVPEEEVEYQFKVNVFGIGKLLRTVLPHMRKQKSGRIIMTASLVAHVSMLGLGWYSATKHAVRALSVALRQEVKSLGIDVVLIEPGVVKTGFEGVAINSFKKLQIDPDYSKKADDFANYIEESYRKGANSKSTVRCIMNAITKRRPRLVYKTTSDSKLLSRIFHFLPQRLIDSMTLKLISKR